jgi:2-oxoglutarate dehydrogenase E1 component
MLQVPIFHVNGENPEAVAQVVRLSMDFRREFQTDVFIDMYGYRRWGHNETDEPSFTQPVLYRAIEQRPSVREGYLKHLLELNGVTADEAEKIAADRRERLEKQLTAARGDREGRVPPRSDLPLRENSGTRWNASLPERQTIWREYTGGPEPDDDPETGVEAEILAELLRKLTELPASFHLHPKQRGMQARREMADGKHPLDWSAAEALALATLATEGTRIRLAGQDTARGTFSQRHAILYDQEEGYPHVPLQHLAPGQAPVEILNSPLNEIGRSV